MNDIKSSLAEVRGKLKMSLNPSNPSALAGEKLNTKSNAHAFDAEDQSDDGIILPDNFSNENTPAKPIKKQEPKKVIKPVVKHVVKPKIKSDDDATEPIVKKQASAAAAVPSPAYNTPVNDESPEVKSVITDINNKDYQSAINKLTKLIQKEKNPVVASNYEFWLGESNYGMKQYDKAINYYQKVLSTKNAPKQDNAQIMIAESNIRRGNVQEAKKAYSALIEKFPQSEFIPKAQKMLQQL